MPTNAGIASTRLLVLPEWAIRRALGISNQRR